MRAAARRPRAACILPLGLRREAVARALEMVRRQPHPRLDHLRITPLILGDPLLSTQPVAVAGGGIPVDLAWDGIEEGIRTLVGEAVALVLGVRHFLGRDRE